MKNLVLLCLALVAVGLMVTDLQAQITVDTGFTVAAQIKPSSYAAWPDSIGADKVVSGFDINKNGKKEFIVMGDPYNAQIAPGIQRPYLFWFEASGNDTYNLLWSTRVPGTNDGNVAYADVTVADIDKDGNLEVIVAVPRHRTGGDATILYVYEFDVDSLPHEPTITSDLGVRPNLRYSTSRVEVADVDGDGENEVVTLSRRDDFGGTDLGRTLIVSHFFGGDINPGTFGYFEQEFIDSSAVLKGGGTYDMGIVDFDGDGKKEIWVATWDLLSLAIYEKTAKDTYVLQADINQARPANDVGVRRSMRWYDANHDGKLEYYFAGITDTENPGNLYMIASTTDVSTLTTASVVTLTPDLEQVDAWSYEGADIGDVNGDGKMDYIVSEPGSRREVGWLQYKGGNPADSSNYRLSTLYKDETPAHVNYSWMTINIGNDIDGDGKREVFLPNMYPTLGDATSAAVIILESKSVSAGVEPVSGELPQGFNLNQNYPNPFNPTTAISFQLPAASKTKIAIYDMLGREVAVLVNETKGPGSYSVDWNAAGMPSGLYLCNMVAGSFSASRKLVLVK